MRKIHIAIVAAALARGGASASPIRFLPKVIKPVRSHEDFGFMFKLVVARAFALMLIAILSINCYAQGSHMTETLSIDGIPVTVSRPAALDAHTRLVLLYHGFGPPASPSELLK